MAHQSTIVENGMTYNVTEFDHTAQEIDDAVSNLGGASTPQGAIAALGAGVRPNLLVNPFFKINQRGQTSYTGNGYTVDMWSITGSRSTLDVTEDGITFSVSAEDTSRRYIGQKFETGAVKSGVDYTLSVLLQSGELYSGTAQFPANSGSYNNAFTIPGIGDGRLNVGNNGVKEVYFIVGQGSSLSLRAAKFEEGARQTFAYKDEDGAWQFLERPDPLEELKCKRIQLILPQGNSLNYAPIGYGYILGASARILIPTPIKMRTNPTLGFINGSISGLTILTTTDIAIPTAVSDINALEYGVSINFVIPSGAENESPCTLRCTTGYAFLNANIV